ncbi:MAG: amino acid racemase [Clostridiales bacterium]|nr:amino acid racemase [Clostridiales bacterium]
MSRILGVIGGLGPMATAYFMELLVSKTDAGCDKDHIETIIHSCPQIPDRTSYILDNSNPDPYPDLLRIGKELKYLGASVIAIPCITARIFKERLTEELGIPVIYGVDETAKRLFSSGIKKAGIMATDGSLKAGILGGVLEDHNVTPVFPDPEYQKEVMALIYDEVKAGIVPDIDRFNRIREHLRSKGAEVFILGCTELSLVKRYHDLPADCFDILEVLAEESVRSCEGKIKG